MNQKIILPGGENGRQERPRLFTINVVITGRCNAACSYCHYYLARNRREVAYDISDELFDVYMDFVSHWSKVVPGTTTYRFSGGEPMVLGDRLFTLADRAYKRTTLKPFVITAGKALSRNWVEKAKQSSINHLYVSIENPIRPAKGAPNPLKVVKAIKELDSTALPILPGVCVIPNDCFKNLYDICAWFYSEIGRIPLISEINYSAYTPPTEKELEDLSENIERVIRDFHKITPLNLFSSVSPELAYGTTDPYIFELDLENTYQMNSENVHGKLDAILTKLSLKNYPQLHCPNTDCNWWEFCGNTKWFWQGEKKNNPIEKLNEYCRFKKIVNDTFYRVLVDPTHQSSIHQIDAKTYFEARNKP